MSIGFEVVESPSKPLWVPVDGTSQLAVGMLVSYGDRTPSNTGGVVPFVAAAGHGNETTAKMPYGVVIGTSDSADSETYSTLATALIKVKTITGIDTAAGQIARANRGIEGMYGKGDPQPMVQIVRITPETVLRGYFRNNATVGTTNITTLSPTAVATTAMTFATFGMTPVVENCTTYCVKGTNAGLYRVTTNTSATAYTYTREWPYTPTTADTFKTVNVRQGYCRMNTDTTYGMWINNVAALTADWYNINVLSLDLGADSGNENCTFLFAPDMFTHFPGTRTT